MKIRKIVHPTHKIPPWYGVSYYDYDRLEAVCHPIPLNLAIAVLHRLWFALKFPMKSYSGRCEPIFQRNNELLQRMENLITKQEAQALLSRDK